MGDFAVARQVKSKIIILYQIVKIEDRQAKALSTFLPNYSRRQNLSKTPGAITTASGITLEQVGPKEFEVKWGNDTFKWEVPDA